MYFVIGLDLDFYGSNPVDRLDSNAPCPEIHAPSIDSGPAAITMSSHIDPMILDERRNWFDVFLSFWKKAHFEKSISTNMDEKNTN